MHQLPRPSPRSATPASNPTANAEPSKNSRDSHLTRSRSSVDIASYTERAGAESSNPANRTETPPNTQDRELGKLNQIIQHFHTKAALIICSSRANLPRSQNTQGEIRQNRWFNLVIDETDVLLEYLQEWRQPDLYKVRPRPLVIEIFLDAAHLTNNQVLVLKDEAGRRFDVANALSNSANTSTPTSKNAARRCEVVLERWTIDLGDVDGYTRAELDDNLPNVYKKGVVLFRSLYTFLRLMPAFRLHRKLQRQIGSHPALKLKFRIAKAHDSVHGQADPLLAPLCPSEQTVDDIVEYHTFEPLVTSVGPLRCSVAYRKNCAFGLADAEALISDHFHGLDEWTAAPVGGRSMPEDQIERSREQYSRTAAPTTARERPRALLGAYGSLGTFHFSEKQNSEPRQRTPADHEHDSDMQRLQKIQAEEGLSTRKSVDYIANPPFKAGSLASSPRPSPSPSTTANKNGGQHEIQATKGGLDAAAGDRRMSLHAYPQQQLRAPSTTSDIAVVSSGSASPKPTSGRYSSSFANRTKRFTPQGGKATESTISSGRASSSSKERSEHLNEAAQGSTGSTKTDDDDIASFISDLEKSKDIKFHTPPSQRETVVNLAKYTSMRDPSTQLAEEMSSSSLIHTSTTPPSRRLSNVPGLSTSSSPSRALAHAPHVRSRLSTHSAADDASRLSAASGEGSSSSPRMRDVEEEEDDEPFIFPHHQEEL